MLRKGGDGKLFKGVCAQAMLCCTWSATQPNAGTFRYELRSGLAAQEVTPLYLVDVATAYHKYLVQQSISCARCKHRWREAPVSIPSVTVIIGIVCLSSARSSLRIYGRQGRRSEDVCITQSYALHSAIRQWVRRRELVTRRRDGHFRSTTADMETTLRRCRDEHSKNPSPAPHMTVIKV
jgi:hypothetical protein